MVHENDDEKQQILSDDYILDKSCTLTLLVGTDKLLVQKHQWSTNIQWNNNGKQIIEIINIQPCKQIPTEFGLCQQLENFYCFENQLTGQIPTEFGLCQRLQFFNCSNNQLTGQIPTEFGSLQRLQIFCCDDNQLTGQKLIESYESSCLNL